MIKILGAGFDIFDKLEPEPRKSPPAPQQRYQYRPCLLLGFFVHGTRLATVPVLSCDDEITAR
jgi:hypothetical protein